MKQQHFLHGWHADSDVIWPHPAERRMADLIEADKDGTNAFVTGLVDGDEDGHQLLALLEQAQVLDVALILPPLTAEQEAVVGLHPARLASYVTDDANFNKGPEVIRKDDAAARQIQPLMPTFAACLPDPHKADLSAYVGVTDYLAGECYPIGLQGGRIGQVYPALKYQVRVCQNTKTIPTAYLQAYRWPGKRLPTHLEILNVAGQAFAAGVEGIFWYAWLFNEKTGPICMRDFPSLRSAVKQVSRYLGLYGQLMVTGTLKADREDDVLLDVTWTAGRVSKRLLVNMTTAPQAVAGLPQLRPLEVRFV